jgi:hypothetical protein
MHLWGKGAERRDEHLHASIMERKRRGSCTSRPSTVRGYRRQSRAIICNHMQSRAIICNHMQSYAIRGHSRPFEAHQQVEYQLLRRLAFTPRPLCIHSRGG